MQLAEKQSIVMQPNEMQARMARLKVTPDKHDFPSNGACFRCGNSTHFANKCNIRAKYKEQKRKLVENVGKKDILRCLQIKTSEITF